MQVEGRGDRDRDRRMRMVYYGCLAFTAAAASIPLAAHAWIGGGNENNSLTDREGALTAPQVRRGAFLNTGSRDVGRDPEWEGRRHRLANRAGYAGIHEDERGQEREAAASLPGESLAMPAGDLKKHEEKIRAFAVGKGSNN